MSRPLFAVCLLVVTIASVFALRGSPPKESLRKMNQKDVIVTGTVYRKDFENFYLESVFLQVQAADLQQKISLQNNLICEYQGVGPKIGSTLILCGRFEEFQEATNPGEFDAARYYASQKVVGKLREITVVETTEEYSHWREGLFLLRGYFRNRLYRVFPEKEASVMAAMLLGDKSDLNPEVKDLYQDNGIIHILSISGLHITMIGMGLYGLLRRVGTPVWLAASAGAVVLVLYGVMTGMGVSAARAIGMYLIRMLGQILGRTYDMLTAMGILAAILVLANPMQLQNAGFLLSFGAVAGIGVVCPLLEGEDKRQVAQRYIANPWLRRLRQWTGQMGKGVLQSLLSGLSVTLMTLPIQLWFYYEVPVYSVVINLLILPFMSLVVSAGLVAMLIPGLGIVGTLDCIILAGYEKLCRMFGQLPFSVWNPGRPKIWQMVVYYGVLAVIIFLAGKRFLMCRSLIILALTILVGVFAVDFPKETRVTFLDVGQGDCICIQLDSGEIYLFDCGSTSRSSVGEYVLKPYLKYCGISHVDAVFVSHMDRDHVSGVEELLKFGQEWGIMVGEIVFSGNGVSTEWVAQVNNFFKEKGYNVPQRTVIGTGDSWQAGETNFTCLHPDRDIHSMDSNEVSQCFYIEMEPGVTLLLTGDVEGAGEERLLEELKVRGIGNITLLKAAHHGSRGSTGSKFLEQVKPMVTIISCGENNSYNHPHKETLGRLEKVGSVILTTPEQGAIVVEMGKEVKIR